MENILVVPTATLRPYLTDRGLIRGKEAELFAVIEKEHLFIPRPEAENDPSYKQIIPYITLCRNDEVFCTRRTNKGGETRLHGRLSLGIGGHINTLDDMDSGDIFRRGLQRELEEEVFLSGGGDLILSAVDIEVIRHGTYGNGSLIGNSSIVLNGAALNMSWEGNRTTYPNFFLPYYTEFCGSEVAEEKAKSIIYK